MPIFAAHDDALHHHFYSDLSSVHRIVELIEVALMQGTDLEFSGTAASRNVILAVARASVCQVWLLLVSYEVAMDTPKALRGGRQPP